MTSTDIEAIRDLVRIVDSQRTHAPLVDAARAALSRIEATLKAADALAFEVNAAGERDDKGVLALVPAYTAYRAACEVKT